MNDEAAFLATIRAAPADDVPRLVYADYLDEHGRPGGAFLRAECELAAVAPTDPRRAELQTRLRDAGTGVDPVWVGEVSRAPIEDCPAEFQARCPKRWELLPKTPDQLPGYDGSVRSCRECRRQVAFCTSTAMAQIRATCEHRVVIDPRLARTPRDLEPPPDDVVRLVHASLYDTREVQTSFGLVDEWHEYVTDARRELRELFTRRGYTDADAAVIRAAVREAMPGSGAVDLLVEFVAWTRPVIESLLDDPLPRARATGVRAVAHLDGPRGVSRFLKDPDPTVRRATVTVKSRPWYDSDPEVKAHLDQALNDEHPDVRYAAVLHIRNLFLYYCRPYGADALTPRLAVETDPVVRKVLIQVLASIGPSSGRSLVDPEPAKPLLLPELNNEDPEVRRSVVSLLGRLRGPDVATALLDRLLVEDDVRTRVLLASYDGYPAIADRALPVLLSLLKSEPVPGIRDTIAYHLRAFGPSVHAALAAAQADREEQGRAAAQRLPGEPRKSEPSRRCKAPGKKKRKRGE